MKLILSAIVLLIATACGASPGDADVTDHDGQFTQPSEGRIVSNESAPINEQFRTLDDYLRYLERQSHMDGKWYKEVRPGIYALQAGNLHLDTPSGEQRVYTREELERKFGFRK